MKFIKNNFVLFLIMLLLFGFAGCKKNNNNDKIETLNIYTVNDFHGSLEEESNAKGISRIAGYIKEQISGKEEYSLILSAGDMFQGSAISNYNHGRTVLDLMNKIGFNAMTIGNHEFDWGFETIQAYRDKDEENGEANFDFLACNIIDKRTGLLPAYIEPYTIIERKNLKIGIIGYIGYGQENDIQKSCIENYYFDEPVELVRQYSYYLRNNEECNVIIAMGHEGSSTVNRQLANLEGLYRIDGIINGHTHSVYNDTYRRSDGVVIPCIQSGSAGSHVGVLSLTIDPNTNEVIGGDSFNKQMSSRVNKDSETETVVQNLITETEPIFGRVLCTAGKQIDRNLGAKFASSALMKYNEADVAFINLGGIRANAFPISNNEKVTVKKVYQIVPFDNTAVTCSLSGFYIRNMLNGNDLVVSSNVTFNNNNYYINGELIDDDKMYKVATINFVYENTSYNFKYATDTNYTEILFRDILNNVLEDFGKNNIKWMGDIN